ncbi:FAD-dependent oxidoreductase [Pseudarthrobacter oxydans]|uniref:FAD-dependent oxidoreductase n=1 Tax=Pseudarthrobacter oxydans TaxID=1671 RepID=UPI0037FD8DF9
MSQKTKKFRVDVAVIGGGTAGTIAALSAARAGASVILIERQGFLGGTLTSSSLGSLCGYYTVVEGRPEPVVGGLPMELVEGLRKMGGSPADPLMWLRTASIPYDLFSMKVLLDRLMEESSVKVLFHSQVTGVATDPDGKIAAADVLTRSGFVNVAATTFIDATGNAEVTALAGGTFDLDVDTMQAPTSMFRFGGVDTAKMKAITRPELHRHLETAVAAGFALPRTAGGMYSVRPGIVHVNITRVEGSVNPFDPEQITAAEMEGRRQILLYEEAFRRFVPGFADAFVLDSGVEIGIRESRRIHGEVTLAYDDVTTSARFPDVIACSAWPIEDHTGDRGIRWVWLDPGEYYQIPLRAMLPKSVANLIVAGRSISATHDAQASVRVTAQCFAMGEAAGLAAVTALEHDGITSMIDISCVQDALLERGAFLGELPSAAPAHTLASTTSSN